MTGYDYIWIGTLLMVVTVLGILAKMVEEDQIANRHLSEILKGLNDEQD